MIELANRKPEILTVIELAITVIELAIKHLSAVQPGRTAKIDGFRPPRQF